MGNSSALAKRQAWEDVDDLEDDRKHSASSKKKSEPKQELLIEQQQLPIHDDVLSLVLSFLDVKTQCLFCSSSKHLYDTFFISPTYNKFLFTNATESAFPILHSTSFYNDISKLIEQAVTKNPSCKQSLLESVIWRRFLLFISPRVEFPIGFSDKLIIEQDNQIASLQDDSPFNFSFALKFKSHSNEMLPEEQYDYSFFLHTRIIKKHPHTNIAIGLGDSDFLDMTNNGRFLGYPLNSLSYSSSGALKFNVIQGPETTIDPVPPFRTNDLVSMHVRVSPLPKANEVLYQYHLTFLLNGQPILPKEAYPSSFRSLRPLYPCFTLHSPGDCLEMLCSSRLPTHPEQELTVMKSIFTYFINDYLH